MPAVERDVRRGASGCESHSSKRNRPQARQHIPETNLAQHTLREWSQAAAAHLPATARRSIDEKYPTTAESQTARCDRTGDPRADDQGFRGVRLVQKVIDQSIIHALMVQRKPLSGKHDPRR